MSDSFTGTHLKSEDLDDKIVKPLIHFGDCVAEEEFEPLTKEVHICKNKDRAQQLKPILEALQYKHINFQIYRVVARAYIGTDGVPAHLIPVWIDGSGAVWDFVTPAFCLRVGQKLYVDKPMVIEARMLFLIIMSRSDESTKSITAA